MSAVEKTSRRKSQKVRFGSQGRKFRRGGQQCQMLLENGDSTKLGVGKARDRPPAENSG